MAVEPRMLPWHQAPLTMRRQVRGIFFDIDDTFSSDGQISEVAYRALWRAHRAGLTLVPITGRPAGWADHIGRMWPVAGVVAENGALATYWSADRLRTIYLLDQRTRARNRRRLNQLQREILRAVPGCGLASDQPYRLFDLAIDYCEDVPALPPAAVQRIVALFERHGATAKVSSIHVNGWFGRYDKLGMCRRLCRDVLGFDLDRGRRHYLFVGDSPNDAPMFDYFPNAVGVANVRRFADQLTAAPRYVTRQRCGAGFAEVVSAVVRARTGPR